MKFAMKGVVAVATALTLIAPLAAGAQELVMSIGSRGYGGMMERNIEAFEAANPRTSVEWLKVSDVPGDSRKLYVTGLTAKSPTPDVFAIDVIWAGEFAQRGWLFHQNMFSRLHGLGRPFNMQVIGERDVNRID